LFFSFALLGIVISLLHYFLPDGGAQVIATIALDSFSEEAKAMVIGMFALLGLSQLLSNLVYAFTLVKRKASLSIAWFLLLIEYVSRWLIGEFKPFETMQTTPSATGKYVFMFISLAMLLWFVVNDKKLIL
jgi:hypothetical protein